MVVAPPVELQAPAPIPSRNVMIWGDEVAMNTMKANFEHAGWSWVTGVMGEKAPMLVLIPPKSVSDDQVTQLITSINAGKYGKLNGGYAQFDLPLTPSGRTL